MSLVWAVLYSLLLQLAIPPARLMSSPPPRLESTPVPVATQAVAAEATAPAAIVLQDVVRNADGIAALGAHVTSNTLLAAVASDDPDHRTLELIDAAGARRTYSSLAAIADPVLATNAEGQVYVAGSADASIARVAKDGTATPKWVTLAGETGIAALHSDTTGVWNRHLIAVTKSGAVWRIDASGTARRVATIAKPASAVLTIADDANRYGPWAGVILVAARDEAALHAVRADGTVEAFAIGVTARDLAIAEPHRNFYGIDRNAAVIRGARAEAFAGLEGDLIVAQRAPGVLARVRWDGFAFVTTTIAEAARWDDIAFAAAGVGAIPAARRIYDAVAVVRHAPLLDSGRIEGALWQLTPESVTLDGTDTITSDLVVPGKPSVVIGSGNPSFGGVIEGSDSAAPATHTVTIANNASLRHLVNRTDAVELPALIPPPAPAGTRDVALTSDNDPIGDFATLRNLTISGKAGDVTVPPGTYGTFSATGRTAFVLGAAGSTSTYNLTRLDLAGGSELRLLGPVVLNVRDGITVNGSSAGAADAPGRLTINSSDDVKVTGTGVLNALVRAPGSLVTVEGKGRLRGSSSSDRLAVAGSGVLQVTQTDVPPPPVNRPPTVDAGGDQVITLPTNSVRLEGSVADDGLPRNAALTVRWTKVSGPAAVDFADETSARTVASFTVPGVYVLRLSGDDTAVRTTDDVQVTVIRENHAPAVDAGDDQTIALPSAATVSGGATDPDGDPLTTTWSKVSGPGDATFANRAALSTKITFTAAGEYTLRLTATDGTATVTDEVTITVDPINEKPVVDAGDDQTIALPATASLAGTATDDGWPRDSVLTHKWTQASGPGVATFAEETKPATSVSFDKAGAYVLRLTVSDGALSASDDVTITVDPINEKPVVDAGADQTIQLPATASLTGSATDDGFPRGSALTYEWTQTSGPGIATFVDEAKAATTVSFDKAGTYVLRLTVSDGSLSASDDVTIAVDPANTAPVVDAGADQTIQLPATATLIGSATDDGFPRDSALTYKWTQASGPGVATFTDDAKAATSVAFDNPGTYVLRLTVGDGALSASADVTVIVRPANQAPAVNAGIDQTIELPNVAVLSATATDDEAVTGVLWRKVSGPGDVTFASLTSPQTSATFSAAGVYILSLTATDGVLESTDDVTITVLLGNKAPIVSAGADQTIRLPETATLTGTATDDGKPSGTLTYQWSVVGAGDVTFANRNALTTVATFSTHGTYTLRLTVSDGELSAGDDVTITVSKANTAPVVSAGADQTLSGARTATLTGTVEDDGLPAATVTSKWTLVSGPAQAAFQDDTSPATTVTFSKPGTYVLRLTANDGVLSAQDEVTIAVTNLPTAAFTVPGAARNAGWIRNNATSIYHTNAQVVAFTSEATAGASRLAFDGHPGTRWRSAPGQVTNQSLTLRVGGETAPTIDRIRFLNNNAEGEGVRLFRVEVSSTTDDPSAYSTVLEGELLLLGRYQEIPLAQPVAVRYLRFTALTGWSTAAVSLMDLIGVDQSKSGIPSFFNAQRAGLYDEGTRVVEASWNSNWSSVNDEHPLTGWWTQSAVGQYLTFKLPRKLPLQGFRLTSDGGPDSTRDFRIDVSTTDTAAASFRTVFTGTALRTNQLQSFVLPGGPVEARYVKLVILNNHGGSRVSVMEFVPAIAVTDPVAVSTHLVAGYGPESLFDATPDTLWHTLNGDVNGAFFVYTMADEPALLESIAMQSGTSHASLAVKDFELQVSNTTREPEAFTTVLAARYTKMNEKQSFVLPGGPVRARYVKFVVRSSHRTDGGGVALGTLELNTVDSEGNIPSAPVPGPGMPRNLSPAMTANGARIAASSGGTPEVMLDFGTGNWWTATGSSRFAVIDLAGDEPHALKAVRVGPRLDALSAEGVKDFEVWASSTTTDAAAFTKVLSATTDGTRHVQTFAFAGTVNAKYLKYVPLTSRATTQTNILTGLFDVVPVVPAGGIIAASSSEGWAIPELALDGNTGSNWITLSGSNTHWLKLAFEGGETRELFGVKAHFYTWAPKEIEIRVSTTTADDSAFTSVYRVPYSSSRIDYYFNRSYPAKYVQYVFHNGTATTSIGVAELGMHALSGDGGALIALSSAASHVPFGPSLLVDLAARAGEWQTVGNTNQWATVALPVGRTWLVDHVALQPRTDCCFDSSPKEIELQVSTTDSDPASFFTVYSGLMQPLARLQHFFFDAVPARYVRVVAKNGWGYPQPQLSLLRVQVFSPEMGSTDARFLDRSTTPGGAVTSWHWDFGDGTTSNERDPRHRYAAAGTYDVTLTITDSNGATSSTAVQYRADGPPLADFSYIARTEGTYSAFTDLSASNMGTMSSRTWSYGDGSSESTFATSINHFYSDSGNFPVTLTVANTRGVRASVTKTLSIANLPPEPKAGPDFSMRWGDTWPNDKSSVGDPASGDHATLVCTWDFGDGTSKSIPAPCDTAKVRVPHVYGAPGVYEATLTATDKDGATASDKVVITASGKRPTSLNYADAGASDPSGPLHVGAVLRDLELSTPIAGRTVVFDVHGNVGSGVTDALGRVEVAIAHNGLPDQVVVSMRFDGDHLYLPVSGSKTLRCPPVQQPMDVAFLFDASGSMDKALPVARKATVEMIDEMPAQHQVSIIRFADTGDVLQPLTLDHAAAISTVSRVTYFGGTDIWQGVDTARKELISVRRNVYALPVMIVLSDGEGNDPTTTANQAKAAGIRIVSIYFKPESGFNQQGYNLMKALASSAADLYVADTPESLDGIYEQIFGTLCTAANTPPLVNAGADQKIMLPALTASLSGTVQDDGLPPRSVLTTTWKRLSGPGTATFANPAARATTVTFSAAGTYELELSASDTQYTGSDTLTITIAANAAPVVNAGADQQVMLPADGFTLSGSVTDDGLPPSAAVTSTWSGPAGVTFANVNAATTGVTFPAAGTYTLTLTASDTLLSASDTVIVTVLPANQPPVAVAGADQALTLESNLLVNGGNEEPGLAGWTSVAGTWSRETARVLRGEAAFTSVEAGAELRQDVDVSAFAAAIDAGTQQFSWSAFVRGATPADVIVEYRGAGGSVLLGRGVEVTAPGDWLEGKETNLAPAGTRAIRVRLKGSSAFDVVTLRAVGATSTKLAGSATDDGIPGPVTTVWSGNASFTDPTKLDTAAAFNGAGTYTLTLTASDGAATSSDEVAVTVSAADPAPALDAGADFEVTLPQRGTLAATVNETAATRWEQIAGPAVAAVADAGALSSSVTFTAAGTYRFRILADDGNFIVFDTVTVTVHPSPANAAPVVNAGADVTVLTSTTTLSATVTDDGLPVGGSVSVAWTGPAGVTFADAASSTTSATFPRHGVYVLRITATDGEVTAFDEITVRYDGTNAAPAVNAGADLTVRIPAAASLAATVTDDHLPLGASLTLTWAKLSGPGDVTFASTSTATTTATFSAAGTYVLSITASDSALSSSDEIAVTVQEAGAAPTVDITSPESGTTITDRTVFTGTVSDGATWRLEYRMNPNDETGTSNPWTTIAGGTGPVNGTLGTFDPTILLNGAYKVRLLATTPDGQSDGVSVSVVVDGELKVGLFRLSFTDAEVALPGLPLQVSRVYDSRDKRVGDFGVGWNVGVLAMRVEKSGVLGTGWEETVSGSFTNQKYCLTQTVPRFVTVTLGNDKVFRFRMKAIPECQAIVPIETPVIVFEPLRGTYAALEAVGESEVYVSGSKPGPVELLDMGGAVYNPTRFRLKLADGTTVEATEAAGIEKMTDRNGNTLTFSEAGIQHSAGRGITFTRDAQGRITELTDAANEKVVYTYDSRGDLVSVKDQAGLVTTFVYNSTHGLVEYFDAAGRKGFTSEYDESGRLIAVIDGAGNRTEMDYDPSLRREAVKDAKGRIHFYDYDAWGNLVATAGPDGPVAGATYDEAGNQLTRTDAAGRTSTFTYDPKGNVLTERDDAGNVTTWTYNEWSQVTSVTDARNHKVVYEYDEFGNRISETDPTGAKTVHTYDDFGRVLTTTDPENRKRSFTYHPDGQLKSETDSRNQVTSYEYDPMGRLTKSVDAKGRATTLVYDAAGKLLTRTEPGGLVTTNEYDEAGVLLATTDVNGVRTETKSDTKGMPTVTTYADGSTHEVTYDANGKLQSSTRTGGLSPSFAYDENDLPSELTLAPGVKVGYGVDELGRVTGETDPRNQTTTYTYNVFDRPSSRTSSTGDKTEYASDEVGNVTGVRFNGEPVVTYEYDEANRPKSFTNPEGHKVSMQYNWRGDITRRTNARGHSYEYVFDGEGNLTRVVEPGGIETVVEYDENGFREAIENAAHERTGFVRDEADRITAIEYPDGSAEHFTYEGTLIDTATDRAGQTVDFDYDLMGRQSKVTLEDGRSTTYTYTATGQRDVVSGPADSVDYDYDAFGRVTRIVRGDGSVVLYGYDDAGNRTTITTTEGTTTYGYDGANRLKTITDAQGRVTEYTYDSDGQVERIDYPNGVSTTRGYDTQGNIVETRSIDAAGAVIFGETYRRDPNGNVEEIVRHDGSGAVFTYDALDRLESETHRNADGSVARSVGYTYDAVGNRRTVTDSTAGSTAAYAYEGELLRSDGRRTFDYDANGDLRTVTAGGSSVTYDYDQRRHLNKVTIGGLTSEHVYDAEGRRVRTTSTSGQTTRFVLDPIVPNARVLAEHDASHTPVASYTWGHEIISMERDGQTYYYVLDAHGSVRALTDAQGNVTDTYAYTAFGELASRTGTTVSPFAYAGEQLDADTGLYFLRARYYDPSIGRFTQWDSFPGTEEQPQTRNRYAYAYNNPVNVVDPSGRVGEGSAEHKEIGWIYILRHGDYYYMRLNRNLNKGFPRLIKWLDYGWGAFDREIRTMPRGNKRKGKPGSRPDLRHYATGEVHEIKPLNLDGWKEAPVQALHYAGWLNYYETDTHFPGEGLPEWSVGKSWATWPPFFKIGGLTTFGPPFTPDGAILYSRNWMEDVQLLLETARDVQKLTTNTLNLLRAMRLIRKAPNVIRDVTIKELERDRVSALQMPASAAFLIF